jgi:AcrR family transcriptional regulator
VAVLPALKQGATYKMPIQSTKEKIDFVEGPDLLPKSSEKSKGSAGLHEPWKAFHVREQRRLDIKRDAVLQTAAQLFLETGYRQTSMRQLAARLNITKPALYYYFRTKEELLIECYRAGIEAIEAALKGALDCEGNGLQKVRAYIHAYATAIVSYDFGRCVAALDDSELSDQTRRQVRTLKRRIDAAIRGYVEEGIADGSIVPCNVKMASFAMAGAVNWIGTWYRPNGSLSPQEIADEFANLLTSGLQRCHCPDSSIPEVPETPAGTRKRRAQS